MPKKRIRPQEWGRIAERAKAGEAHADIAADYGISRTRISQIVRAFDARGAAGDVAPPTPRKKLPTPKRSDMNSMSCYPPDEVAATFGAYKTVELSIALQVYHRILARTMEKVGALFSPQEWEQLAEWIDPGCFDWRAHSGLPRVSDPGMLLANLLNSWPVETTGGDSASLADRLRALPYEEAWALIFLVRFRQGPHGAAAEGRRWWEVPVRWRIIRGEADAA